MNIRKEKKKFKLKNKISGNVYTKVYRNLYGDVICVTFLKGEISSNDFKANKIYEKPFSKDLAMKIWQEDFMTNMRNHLSESLRNQFNIEVFQPRHIIIDHSMNV